MKNKTYNKFIAMLIPLAMVAMLVVAAWMVLWAFKAVALIDAKYNVDNVSRTRSVVSGEISDSISAPKCYEVEFTLDTIRLRTHTKLGLDTVVSKISGVVYSQYGDVVLVNIDNDGCHVKVKLCD